MDEFAINPCARYHRHSNEVVGFCSNHSTSLETLKFTHWDDFIEIKNAYAQNVIHLAKEKKRFFLLSVIYDIFYIIFLIYCFKIIKN